MKTRTKILTAALFATIFAYTSAGTEIEKKAFVITAPSAALVDLTLNYASQQIKVAPEEAHFLKLAQR